MLLTGLSFPLMLLCKMLLLLLFVIVVVVGGGAVIVVACLWRAGWCPVSRVRP